MGLGGKREKAGGVLAKRPSSSSLARIRTEMGGRAGGRPVGVLAGGPVLVGDQRMGEKEEEAEGIRFPYLPWAVAARGEGSTVAGKGRWCRLWAAGSGA
jgi:hypothetical protein